jgi:ankyrin repeat protein
LINNFNAEVNNINSQTLWTPFHWAARHGDYEIVKLMIEKGAKAFTPDSKGYFPIHLAGYF